MMLYKLGYERKSEILMCDLVNMLSKGSIWYYDWVQACTNVLKCASVFTSIYKYI